METTIKEKVMNNISSLQKEIYNLETKIRTLHDEIKKEISQIGDIVEELAIYIKLRDYPTELYSTFSRDAGDYDNYKNIRIKVVYDYGYTDIVGLTSEEFKRLQDIIDTKNNLD